MDYEQAKAITNVTLKKTSELYLEIFQVKSVEEISNYFILKEPSDSSICLKPLQNVGGWRCDDCIKTNGNIFCQDCWSLMKDKHKDHKIFFIRQVEDFCNCGDINCIDQKYFCPKHNDKIESDSEMNKYILDNLGKDISSKIKSNLEKLFNNMFNFYLSAINDDKTKTDDFFEVVNNFFDCLEYLSKPSKACTFIIAELMLKKYTCKLKHTCLEVNEQGGRIVKDSVFSHNCICPFIRFVLEFWPDDRQSFLHSLIKNDKLRKIIGTYYFLFYVKYVNDRVEDFDIFSKQLIYNDSLKIACNIPGLIDKIYEMDLIMKTCLGYDYPHTLLSFKILDYKDTQKYDCLNDILSKLQQVTLYLIKPVSFNYLANNANIICKIIDLINYIHNFNVARSVVPAPLVDLEPRFFPNLLEIEIKLLGIFSFFISIFNFNDNDSVKSVFSYFSKMILKKMKNKLSESDYSIHIPIYRAFSIFLNRYCFSDANKTNSNILLSFQKVAKIMPDLKKCSEKMIKGVFKVFGFITGCELNFFNYHGKSMSKYSDYYYNIQFIYRDFCLLKYLLTIKENAKFFSFINILYFSMVENSCTPMSRYILNGGYFKTNNSWTDSEVDYFVFNKKILTLFLSLLRNNTCFLYNLSSGFIMSKFNRIRDTLIEDIFQKNINYFMELTKELIIEQIIEKVNSASFSEIYNKIFLCLSNFFGEKYIKDIILTLTNQIVTKDNEIKFSLKDEIFSFVDLNYIIHPPSNLKVEKYINDLKNEKISIFNIYIYPNNKYESKLIEDNYNQLYFNTENFDFIFKYINFLITKVKEGALVENFLSILLNYLSTFLSIETSQISSLRENIKIDLIPILENNDLSDTKLKSYCKYVAQKLKNNKNNENKIQNEIKSEEKKEEKSIQQDDKTKTEENQNNKELLCMICNNPIEKNNIEKPYGVLGDIISDNYIANAFYQTIKKEYNKHKEKNPQLKEFDQMYNIPSDSASARIISCNHYAHFSCFFKQYIQDDLCISIFKCPLCNRLNNTFVPKLYEYTNEQTKGFFKGFDFNFIFEFGKEHIEEYVKEIEAEKKEELKENEDKNENNNEIKEENVNFIKEYPYLVNSCKYFIETFFVKSVKIKGINLESDIWKTVFDKYTPGLGIHYRDLFSFFDNIEQKNPSIILWRNFVLSMRLMLKLDIINKEKYFLRLYKLIKEFITLKFDSTIESFIKNNSVKTNIWEILLLISFLFEYEEVEGYEKYILYMVLPIYAVGLFWRKLYLDNAFCSSKEIFSEKLTMDELNKFLKDDTSINMAIVQFVKQLLFNKAIMNKNIDIDNISLELNDNLDLLNLGDLKNKNLIELLDELEKLIDADSVNEKMKHINNNFKTQNNYKDIFQMLLNNIIEDVKNEKCDNVLHGNLFGACLPTIYKFIDLPENALDFEYQLYNKECEYCKKKGQLSLLCLYCGKKICNSEECTVEINGNKIGGVFIHSHKCGGWRSAFLRSRDCSVMFGCSNFTFGKLVPLYLDEFGECNIKDKLGRELKLNHEAVKKCLKIFTEYTYSDTAPKLN